MENEPKILALYDFASKQDYIYKTSKIKEISGASLILGGMYEELIDLYNEKHDGKFTPLDKCEDFLEKFSSSEYDAQVLYEGGGNLMVIYKTIDEYKKANKLFSEHIIKNYPGFSMIVSHTEVTEIFDKKDEDGNPIGDRDRLYAENAKRKNLTPAYDMPTVTPFTQIDPMTFLPVTYKRNKGDASSVYPASEVSLSSDRVSKVDKYNTTYNKNNNKNKENKEKSKEEKSKEFDDDSGMLAVIYIDGNSMGKKLQSCKSEKYAEGIKNLRAFSKDVKASYVDKPLNKIESNEYVFRKVIGGGDEITIICKAEDALEIMKTYFECLSEEGEINGKKCCTSCAGIAVFHAKSPFSVAYGIAEAACESAKDRSRSTETDTTNKEKTTEVCESAKDCSRTDDDNYFDFYYCHSGITADFDALRKLEQKHATGRPYAVSDLSNRFSTYEKILKNAGRSNVKDLGAAAQISLEQYKLEVSRVNAYLGNTNEKLDGSEKEMELVYDMSEFYDLWFSKSEKAEATKDE